MLEFLKDHWFGIAVFAAVWAALATSWAKSIPLPPAGWKRYAHIIIIDWPASLPLLDMKGVFGMPYNIPFLTLSVREKPDGSLVIASPPPIPIDPAEDITKPHPLEPGGEK